MAARGTQIGGRVFSGPVNPGSRTPTMVTAEPLIQSRRPTEAGSPANSVCQKCRLTTATGSAPGRSSAGPSDRPSDGRPPSSGRYPPLTNRMYRRCSWLRSGAIPTRTCSTSEASTPVSVAAPRIFSHCAYAQPPQDARPAGTAVTTDAGSSMPYGRNIVASTTVKMEVTTAMARARPPIAIATGAACLRNKRAPNLASWKNRFAAPLRFGRSATSRHASLLRVMLPIARRAEVRAISGASPSFSRSSISRSRWKRSSSSRSRSIRPGLKECAQQETPDEATSGTSWSAPG